MPISSSEQRQHTCPACGNSFLADVWTLLDGAERPDLAQALVDDTLNTATCPNCGAVSQVNAAMLFHDPERRRVYFAVPSGVDEHRWREQAQQLLYTLVESLPEEARLPYLGDVQVEQELGGVRRAVLRRQRGRGGRGNLTVGKPIPLPSAEPSPPQPAPVARPMAADADLVDAVQLLISADSVAEFREVVQRHPVLLADTADDLLGQMADAAYGQGERDMAGALREARTTLARLRAGAVVEAPAQASGAVDEQPAPARLSSGAYQNLLRSASTNDLLDTVRAHPALLEPWADEELAARTEAALDEGNERLASLIDERRDALAGLRLALADEAPLAEAVQALLGAANEDDLEQALTVYPILLADLAQDALAQHAATAQQRGDERQASRALERRAMLQQVRAGLER